jgi:hypothetical protein
MGKTFHLLSTDPVVRRRMQQAHELRNAYLRAALIRWLQSCVLWLTRPHPNASAGPVRVDLLWKKN